MAVCTISPVGGQWSEATAWVEAKVPGAGDEVVANTLSGNLTIEATAECLNIMLAGYKGTLTIKSATLKVFGNLEWPASMSLAGSTAVIEFLATTAGHTVSKGTAGVLGTWLFAGAGGAWTLETALSAVSLSLTAGTLNTNGQSITLTGSMSASGTTTRTLQLGASVINLTGATGTLWSLTATGLTFASGTSTIEVTSSAGGLKLFAGAAMTYYKVVLSGNHIELKGNNTFAELALNNAGRAEGIEVLQGTTQTVTSAAGLTCNGKEGSLCKLLSTIAGKPWKIKVASGTVSLAGVSLKDSTAEGGANFYAGATPPSENVSGNTGWKFEASSKTVEETVRIRAGGKLTVTAAKVATGTAAVSAGSRLVEQTVKVATAGVTARAGSSIAQQASKVAVAAPSIRSGAVMAVAAQRMVQGAVSVRTGVLASVVGVKIATGSSTVAAGAGMAVSGKLVAVSRPTVTTGARVILTIAGKKTVEGTVVVSAGSRMSVQGVKVATAAVASTAGARATTIAVKVATGAVTVAAGGRLMPTGLRVATGTVRLTGGVRLMMQPVKVATGTTQIRGGSGMTVSASRAVQASVVLMAGSRAVVVSRGVFVARPVTRAGVTLATISRVTFAGVARLTAGARLIITGPVRPTPPEFGAPITGFAQGVIVGRDQSGYARAGVAVGPTTGEAGPTREEGGP